MSKPITTFEDFIRRIIIVVFWVALLSVVLIVPIYYALDSVFHFNPDLFALMTVKPDQFLQWQLNLISTEPYRTIFALTTFPGFAFVAVYGTIFMGWVERKLTAKIQLRTGPMNAGRV